MSSMPSFRGGFAPRRGRGGWRSSVKNREPVKPDIVKHPLGQLLQTFQNSDLGVAHNGLSLKTAITDCQYVASYNWLNERTPTVIVPGKPPQWTPLPAPERLPEDSGQYFRDPNAAKYPNHPMAPVVHAILDIDPAFETASIGLFACGSTLGNLLRFVRGMDKAFRFNVEVIGNTVFFVRKEDDPRELIPNVRGFNHGFTEGYTTWEKDVKGSETHQRIVQYGFGDFKCLVRFECDGYLKDASTSNETPTLKGSDEDTSTSISDENDLLQAFQGATVSQSLNATTTHNGTIVIKHGGSEVPQHSIFDLKTRSGRRGMDIDMSDIYPVLWIKQIPNFIVAYHDGHGLFQDIRVQDIRKDVQAWEKDNIDAIRRLSVLLGKITNIAKNDARGLLEVYFSGEGGLQIRNQHGEGTHALPAELMEKWADNEAFFEVTGSNASDDANDDHRVGKEYDSDRGWKADSDDEEPDYTACSAEDCGYCGRCSY